VGPTGDIGHVALLVLPKFRAAALDDSADTLTGSERHLDPRSNPGSRPP
jgi:hypothetical protein